MQTVRIFPLRNGSVEIVRPNADPRFPPYYGNPSPQKQETSRQRNAIRGSQLKEEPSPFPPLEPPSLHQIIQDYVGGT